MHSLPSYKRESEKLMYLDVVYIWGAGDQIKACMLSFILWNKKCISHTHISK